MWPEAKPTNQVLVLHFDPGAPLERSDIDDHHTCNPVIHLK